MPKDRQAKREPDSNDSIVGEVIEAILRDPDKLAEILGKASKEHVHKLWAGQLNAMFDAVDKDDYVTALGYSQLLARELQELGVRLGADIDDDDPHWVKTPDGSRGMAFTSGDHGEPVAVLPSDMDPGQVREMQRELQPDAPPRDDRPGQYL